MPKEQPVPKVYVTDSLWSDEVRRVDPRFDTRHASTPAYVFGAGDAVFYQKLNPHSETERSRGSQGDLDLS